MDKGKKQGKWTKVEGTQGPGLQGSISGLKPKDFLKNVFGQ